MEDKMALPTSIEVRLGDSQRDHFHVKFNGKRGGLTLVVLSREQLERLAILCANALEIWPED